MCMYIKNGLERCKITTAFGQVPKINTTLYRKLFMATIDLTSGAGETLDLRDGVRQSQHCGDLVAFLDAKAMKSEAWQM